VNILRRIADWIAPESRAREVSWNALRGQIDTTTGALVSPALAENLSSVMACVGAISSGISSLPAYIYRRVESGRDIDEDHPVARLIANGPNEQQTWADWLEWTMAQVLLRGNALSQVISDGRGRVIGLQPVPWEHVSVKLLASGRLVFDITEFTNISGGTGRTRRLLQNEVFLLRDRSDDGLLGKSRLQRAASVLTASAYMQDFAVSLYAQGVNPSGVLTADGHLSDEQAKRLRDELQRIHGGSRNAARSLVLGNGLKWSQMSLDPEAAEFLASRRFSVEEICRIFGVPPPAAGDLSHGSFANVESLLRWFAVATLSPWCRKIESEFQRSVLGSARTHELELDLSGLLRGDPAQRWQAWEIALRNNVLSPDEIRLEEGWNPGAPAKEQAPA